MNTPLFESYGYSDIGIARTNNEDIWISYPESGLFTIADGMGGHKAGEVAANEATKYFSKEILLLLKKKSKFSKNTMIDHMSKIIGKTNSHVHTLSLSNEAFKGIGTTFCCIFFFNETAIYAHIGDSRIYSFSENKLSLLTSDHSLANKLKNTDIKNKKDLPPACRNIITRAIGTMPIVKPDIDHIKVKKEDMFFLCTDGLSDYVSAEEISKVLDDTSKNLSEKTLKLIDTAKINGSHDNITALLLQIKSI